MRPVDLGELLPSIRASIVLSRQDLDLDVEPDVVTENNPEHLERLFRDIIENALRFASARVVLRAASGTTTVQVEVLDDGLGIPAAERDACSAASSASIPAGSAVPEPPCWGWQLPVKSRFL